MMYENTKIAKFHQRPNRFIAHVEVDGKMEIAHVKNTGRCKELLIPGVEVVVQKAENPERKTPYTLLSVWKGEQLINMDSSAPNKVFGKYLQEGKHIKGITHIKPEAKWGSSRFDFYVEAGKEKILIETKGVTLEENGFALFPDAPTQRGVRHIEELIRYTEEGGRAQLVFIVQMKGVSAFAPNNKTHKAFGDALVAAKKAGVSLFAYDCVVTEGDLVIDQRLTIHL